MFMSLNAFQLRTVQDGYNSGRIYYFQVDTKEERDGAIEEIKNLVHVAKIKAEGASKLIKSQNFARWIYESFAFQVISALLIVVVRITVIDLWRICT